MSSNISLITPAGINIPANEKEFCSTKKHLKCVINDDGSVEINHPDKIKKEWLEKNVEKILRTPAEPEMVKG